MKSMVIAFAMVATVLLVACNGGTSSSGGPAGTPGIVNAATSIPSIDRLPPEPDEKENDKTAAGIDADGDGIRDDVQRWIAVEFKDSARKRMAMAQMARAYQVVMVGPAGAKTIQAIDDDIIASIHCQSYVFDYNSDSGVSIEGYKAFEEMESRYMNTPERYKVRLDLESAITTRIYGGPETEDEYIKTCYVDPESLND